MVINTIIIPKREIVMEVALNKFKRDLLNFLPQKFIYSLFYSYKNNYC